MKFIVKRTSLLEGKPCEEATLVTLVRTDERNCDDPAKIPAGGGDSQWWHSEGLNHRMKNGRIKRDWHEVYWVITLDTLDDLLAFNSRYGTVILFNNITNPALPMLEIYDKSRE